jgi:ADP-ribosylation factor-binding protein GGA
MVQIFEVLISNACDPSLSEPNYAHHDLETADRSGVVSRLCVHLLIPARDLKPRELVMLITRLINYRSTHIAIFALALLDTLVQSCGYELHLQIAQEWVHKFTGDHKPIGKPNMKA